MPKENSKGFAEAYKTTLRENRKRYIAESHRPGQINKARQLSSRSRYPVSGTVAPIERTGHVSNPYQHGNLYNIANDVADRERHDDVSGAIEAKNWQDRVRRVSNTGYYDPKAHANNSNYWNASMYPTSMRNENTGYYSPEVHATTGRERKRRP